MEQDTQDMPRLRIGALALPRWEVALRLLVSVACLAGIGVCFSHLPPNAVHVVGLLAVLVLLGSAVGTPLIVATEDD